jgi:hypothetical protein
MQVIPLQAVPNQALLASLNGQTTQLNVYQKRTGLFLDIYVANSLVLSGVRCRNLTLMVMDAYLGFVGDLIWFDNQGRQNPDYTGLGGRYSLVYLLPSDIPPTTSIPPLSRYS